METTTITTPAALETHLLAAGVKGPSLHPDVDSDDRWKRWNGWNQAVAMGMDAHGRYVSVEVWEFASGHRDWEANGHLAGRPHDDLAYPLEMLPALPNIRHPEHTPA